MGLLVIPDGPSETAVILHDCLRQSTDTGIEKKDTSAVGWVQQTKKEMARFLLPSSGPKAGYTHILAFSPLDYPPLMKHAKPVSP